LFWFFCSCNANYLFLILKYGCDHLVSRVWFCVLRTTVKVSPSLTDAAMARISQGTKVLTEGGHDKVFQQTFEVLPGEKFLNAYACYISTSTGPVIGTLYISSKKVAFCSEHPFCYYSPTGQQQWMYYKVIIFYYISWRCTRHQYLISVNLSWITHAFQCSISWIESFWTVFKQILHFAIRNHYKFHWPESVKWLIWTRAITISLQGFIYYPSSLNQARLFGYLFLIILLKTFSRQLISFPFTFQIAFSVV